MSVAALFVEPRGSYSGLEGVELWDEKRDARRYAGPHPAKKATWLYAFGVNSLPELRWGHVADTQSEALVSWCGNHVKSGEVRPRVGKRIASRTPIEFRDALLDIARSARATVRKPDNANGVPGG